MVGEYLDGLVCRVKNGEPSAWQEGLQKYRQALAFRLDPRHAGLGRRR
jgi:hypothetical protein